jgi:CheY-like chemotaxis protein
VLLLSGAFETVDEERARAVGAAGVITKPIDPAVLLARVTDLLTQNPLPDASAATSVEAAASPLAAQPQVPHTGAPRADQYFDEIDRAFANLKKGPKPAWPPEPEPAPYDERDALVPIAAPALPAPAGSPLQDAFATLLDAERTGAVVLPLGRIALSAAPAQPAPAIDVNALADQIAARVLQQLSDRVVRETVTDLVSRTAERLVRDEIERIKRDIT